MTILESYIERKVTSFAESKGWMQRKVVYQNRAGSPDRWYFADGARLKIIEFKQEGQKLKPHQVKEIARLRDMGFDVHVIDNIEDGKALFE